MIHLKEKAEPEAVDALTVCDDLRRAGQLEEAGGEAYVHSLPTVVPAVGAVMHYARIVHDHALLRSLLYTTRDIQGEVLAHRGEPRELIERAEAALFRIGHDGGSAEMRTIEAVLHEEIDKLEELSRKDVGLTGVPSGFADLDSLTGGFQPGNLIVRGGSPVDGQEHARHQHRGERGHRPRRAGGAVLAGDVGDRAGPPLHRLSGQGLERRAAEGPRARRSLAEGPERHGEAGQRSHLPRRLERHRRAGDAREGAPACRRASGLGLLVVDYLQLVRADTRSDSRVEQVGQISRGLKILARELEIPVIAVSQLSRAVESRNPPIPMLSDLRESGQLEQDADLVMFVYREEYYLKEESERPGEADVIIAKHRNGPIGQVALSFQSRYPRFMTLLRERSGDVGAPHNGAG